MSPVPLTTLIGRIPGVVGAVEKFISILREGDSARYRPAFISLMKALHGLFQPFVKTLPEEEEFLDYCEDAFNAWLRGK